MWQNWPSVCSIAACIYGHDQIWPVDLCKDSCVRHQWRQCETEHWAFSDSTTTSKRLWVMTHVSERDRSSSWVSWNESRPFMRSSVGPLIQKTEAENHLEAVQLEASDQISMSVCSFCLVRFLQIYDAAWHTNCLRPRRRRSISWPCFSAPWLLRTASGSAGKSGLCLADCLPSIMNNLLTIRGCCRALLRCRAPQPETLSHSLITG